MQHRRTAPQKLIVAGMFALVAANIVRYVLGSRLGLTEAIADPVSGFCYGIAIATMLLGIAKQARLRR